MRKLGLSFLSLLLALTLIPIFPQSFVSANNFDASHETAVGKDGMVVTAHPEASKIGAKVLQTGGNAVDAAIAIHFALNVAEPMMSGIGGGGFMMVYDAKTEDISVINSRERALRVRNQTCSLMKTESQFHLRSAISTEMPWGFQEHWRDCMTRMKNGEQKSSTS